MSAENNYNECNIQLNNFCKILHLQQHLQKRIGVCLKKMSAGSQKK